MIVTHLDIEATDLIPNLARADAITARFFGGLLEMLVTCTNEVEDDAAESSVRSASRLRLLKLSAGMPASFDDP